MDTTQICTSSKISTHRSHHLKQRKERIKQRLKKRLRQLPIKIHPLKQRRKHNTKDKEDQNEQQKDGRHLGHYIENRQ